MPTLKPDKNIQKLLISSPAQFMGEYDTEDLAISLAFPDIMNPRFSRTALEPSPTYRTFMVATFRTEDQPPESGRLRPIPNHYPIGDFLAICLGVFFGKRVDHHGFLETQGILSVPSYRSIEDIWDYKLPQFNSDPRPDLGLDLNIAHLEKIQPILHGAADEKASNIFFIAGGYYLRSLRMLHEHPENAYLDLVAAGEVLAGYYQYSDFELFEASFLALLEEIRNGLPGGEKKAKTIKNSMYQVKKRFVLSLDDLVYDQFFAANESVIEWAVLQKEKKVKAIKSAYDIRSKYVHTGLRFGNWITAYQGYNAEVMMGEPVIADKEVRKLLINAPMFHGMERLIRYALLRFVHLELCPIDDRLEDPPHSFQDEDVALAAYYIWERDEKPPGQESKHWSEAIKQLRRQARAATI